MMDADSVDGIDSGGIVIYIGVDLNANCGFYGIYSIKLQYIIV